MKYGKILKDAFRNILGNKTRAFFMMLGIIVSIATITVVVSIGQGAQQRVTQGLAKMGQTQTIMIVPGAEARRPGMRADLSTSTLTLDDVKVVKSEIKGVYDAAASAMAEADVKAGTRNLTTTIVGATPNYAKIRSIQILRGEMFSDEEMENIGRVAVIGTTVAKKLFPGGDAIGETIRINNIAFKVIGEASPRGASLSGRDADDMVIVPQMTFANRLFGTTSLSQIIVQTQDVSKLSQMKKSIEELLLPKHNTGAKPDFQVLIPSMQAQSNFGISTTMNLFLWAVSGISLIVGGIMIMNIMLISVGERTKEIGLRKALGARKKDILVQFLTEAAAIAGIGGLIGIPAGVLASKALSLATGWPTIIYLPAVAGALLFAVLVGIGFGIAPARRAAEMVPVEALRSE